VLALILYLVAVWLADYSAGRALAIYVAVFLGVLLLIWIIVNPTQRGSKSKRHDLFR
jgi:thiol:disulfide interchange protein